MSAHVVEDFARELGELRHEVTRKRVRAIARGRIVVDSTRALLVYEPGRVVPCYAVPALDVRGELREAGSPADGETGAPPILDASTPFAVHTCAGRPLSVVVGDDVLEGAAFEPADPDLEGYVTLDFDAFDGGWFDEEEPVFGHPRDPFHAMEILQSSRRVRVEWDGAILAESRRALLLFEGLPAAAPQAYLPRQDLRVVLQRTGRRTTCAYKGHATHWALAGDDEPVACSFETPLRAAAELAGLIAFSHAEIELFLDGERQPR